MNSKELLHTSPAFSRRLLARMEHTIQPGDLSQTVDVNAMLPETEQVVAKDLPGYYIYGGKLGAQKIREASQLGISTISLRFVSSAADAGGIDAGIDIFEKTLRKIISELHYCPVKLIVDPFGLALTANGQWGVCNNMGVFDKEETLRLLGRVGFILSSNNVHGVITLGRIPEEVKATKEGITLGGGYTQIYSFSQNSETSTAYVYLDTPGHNTGQKILPGNIAEMDLWALIDIWHGADVSVVKPMESYHLISSIRSLNRDPRLRNEFLSSSVVEAIAEQHEFSRATLAELRENSDKLTEKCHNVKIGGYTVSGTTFMLSLLAQKKGEAMARARLE